MATPSSRDVDRLTAHINLDAIIRNWQQLEALAPNTSAMPVLKADAYGHGMIPVAKALAAAGCVTVFTASIAEAVDIKQACPSLNIAFFDGPSPQDEDAIIAHGLIAVVNNRDQLHCLAAMGRAHNVKLPAMLHVDTGMNRLGIDLNDITSWRDHPDLDQIDWQVVMSHLAMADMPSDPMNVAQKSAFDAFLANRPPALASAKASLSATAGIMLGEGFHYDITRPGIGLYGMAPAADVAPDLVAQLSPALRLSGRVLQIGTARAGSTVGYGKTHTASINSTLATIGGGYADCIPRQLSNNGAWTKSGYEAPIVGRVSMDVHVVDITDWPDDALAVGDALDVITNADDIHHIASLSGTIAHDVLTRLGLRAKRHYAGTIVKELDL